MTDFSWEAFGAYKVHIGAAALSGISAALAVIPGAVWTVGAVVIGVFAIGYIGKKLYDAYVRFQLRKWLQTQLESGTISAELRQEYTRMLANLIN